MPSTSNRAEAPLARVGNAIRALLRCHPRLSLFARHLHRHRSFDLGLATRTIQSVQSDQVTLVFDGDQTIWDFRWALVRALEATRVEIARVAGVGLEAIPSVGEMSTARDELASESTGTRLEIVRRAAFAQLLVEIGTPGTDATIDHINTFFIGRRYEMCRPYRDAVHALQSLGGLYRVVLLTNGNTQPDKLGLGSLFAHTFYADDIGAAKPSPAAYAHVVSNCASDTFVSIGDSIANDIDGPHDFGWKTVWVNRDSRDLPRHSRPDAVVTSLTGLEDTLARIVG